MNDTLTPFHSFAFDEVSQLDQDVSIALANIREWRNSFIRINRLPLDILSLIPTHLPSQKDHLRASFVCRHWRMTLLQRAELWSKLFLSKGDVYVETFLQRAKGSALDIIIARGVSMWTMALLSSDIGRMRSLDFSCVSWTDLLDFSLVNIGPLPRLRALTIDTRDLDVFGFNPPTPPPQPLFNNAVNVRELCLRSRSQQCSPSFACFNFPNLVSFEFLTVQSERFRASQLLDFLEASPALRTVDMTILGRILFDGVPRERVVTLPNVENFNLIMSDGGPGYKIAAHISCPSARSTSLMHKSADRPVVPEEIFPCSGSWNAIVRQYSRSPVEEVALELEISLVVSCELAFRSADGTHIKLCFKAFDKDNDGYFPPSPEMQNEVLTQATNTVQNHPLANIKRLWVCHAFRFVFSPEESRVEGEIRRLLKSVSPLDELTISRCHLRPYHFSLFNLQEGNTEEPAVLPRIKKLTISHPKYTTDYDFKVAIVGMAERQHALGVPFEHVVIRGENMPAGVREGLRPWVGNVEHCYDKPRESNDD